MRAPLAVAVLLALCAAPDAGARVAHPMGRSPRLSPRLDAPRLWVERSGLFSVSRPLGDLWRFDGTQRDSEGSRIPLVARSEETGAQLSVQTADGVPSAKALARLLAEKLSEEQGVDVDDPRAVAARGGEGYAFTFTSADEQRGRVAVVPAGDHLLLIVASWPLGSPAQVAEEVDSMIRSVGPAEQARR